MTSEGALERWARERPEAPFVFFRGRRGHFRWLSYAAALAFPGDRIFGPGRDDWAPPEVAEIVAAARDPGFGLPPTPAPVVLPPPSAGRDIWISWRRLDVPEEAALAGFAIRSGAAILAERSDRFPIGLFVWARPTIVSAPAAELEALLAALAVESPRFLRLRWLRQHLGRLRFLLVEGDGTATDADEIHRRLRELLPGATAAIRPFQSPSV